MFKVFFVKALHDSTQYQLGTLKLLKRIRLLPGYNKTVLFYLLANTHVRLNIILTAFSSVMSAYKYMDEGVNLSF